MGEKKVRLVLQIAEHEGTNTNSKRRESEGGTSGGRRTRQGRYGRLAKLELLARGGSGNWLNIKEGRDLGGHGLEARDRGLASESKNGQASLEGPHNFSLRESKKMVGWRLSHEEKDHGRKLVNRRATGEEKNPRPLEHHRRSTNPATGRGLS